MTMTLTLLDCLLVGQLTHLQAWCDGRLVAAYAAHAAAGAAEDGHALLNGVLQLIAPATISDFSRPSSRSASSRQVPVSTT